MNRYGIGNQVKVFLAFTIRALTPTETATFTAGGGLPNGVGVDQVTVACDYSIDNGLVLTLGTSHDGVGAYSAVIPATVSGTYRYRGYSIDAQSVPVAATEIQSFIVDSLTH